MGKATSRNRSYRWTRKEVTNSAVLRAAIAEIVNDYKMGEIQSLGIEVGRSLRFGNMTDLGLLDELSLQKKIQNSKGDIDEEKVDVFGNKADKSIIPQECENCTCENCHETVESNIFSLHLEKCLNIIRPEPQGLAKKLQETEDEEF